MSNLPGFCLGIVLLGTTAGSAAGPLAAPGNALGAGPPSALPVADGPARAERPERPPRLTPAQAAAQAQRRHGGKVLDVTLERRGSRAVYRVKLLQDGNVRNVRVPAD